MDSFHYGRLTFLSLSFLTFNFKDNIMAYRLESQTTLQEESIIGQVANRLHAQGCKNIVIYRNKVEVALATVALASTPLSQKFNRVVGASGNFCLVGTRNAGDEQRIRAKVRDLKKAAGLTGGVI